METMTLQDFPEGFSLIKKKVLLKWIMISVTRRRVFTKMGYSFTCLIVILHKHKNTTQIDLFYVTGVKFPLKSISFCRNSCDTSKGTSYKTRLYRRWYTEYSISVSSKGYYDKMGSLVTYFRGQSI